MKKIEIVVILMLFVILAACIAGCTSSQTSDYTGPTTDLREDATYSPLTGIPTDRQPVTSTTRQPAIPATHAQDLQVTLNSINTWTSDNQFTNPKAGDEFLLVDFTIKNIGLADGYYFNPNYASIRDPDGYTYQYHSASYGVPGYFASMTIPYGEVRRGKLVFEVANKPDGTSYYLTVMS